MPNHLAALAALAVLAASPALAQEGWGVAADIGLGAEVEPDWLGAKDMSTGPWVIFRNFDVTAPGETAGDEGTCLLYTSPSPRD